MTQIDFYIPGKGFTGDRFKLACRLSEKAYQAGNRVCISTENRHDAELIHQLLWTYSAHSFLPHELSPDSSTNSIEKQAPILIISQLQQTQEHHVLINLGDKTPSCFSQFERLLEPLDNNEETKLQGRKRYRYYRDCGYSINNHEIKN